jgi:hypothetical protein
MERDDQQSAEQQQGSGKPCEQGFSKKVAAKTPMSGVRTTMMPGAMASQGPMTRANARVLAFDSGVAGMGFLPIGLRLV